jgi:hypothetical protein
MDKDDRATAARRKSREDPVADRAGKGGKPINVKTEAYALNESFAEACWTGYKEKGMKKKGNKMVPNCVPEEVDQLQEKNVPTNPALWSRAKSLARSKFDVYPSAYANGWASKWYKGKGGGWKSVSEETINEISAELVGRVNTLRRIGPDIMKGTAPTPHKTEKSAETLAKAVDKVRNNSKVGAPPMKEDVHSMFEEKYIKQHGLYKYNKRSGMWDHQRSVSPETKDQYLDIFKKDEPNEHFVVAKNRPKHNPLKENVDSMFAEKFGKDREAVARSGQEPKDKDLVMRSGDRKTSDKGYRTQAIVKQVIEAKDKGEYDYEGDMAQSQLRSIMHNAQQINDMLKPNTNMPEWVQSKITLAADYISTCADYLESNKDA